jgi:methylenetetrahydrofolate reductase (NADH)
MRAIEQQAVAAALRRPRYEVFPLDSVVDRVMEHLPADVTVTVTASPTKGIEPTLTVAERLAAQGRQVVPHLAARLIADEVHLKDVLQRLADHGMTDALVIAGDAKQPAGSFTGALDLLTAMAGLGHQLAQVGIAGYPERHPLIDDDVTIQAMWDKRRFATYIVSQLCFRPRAVAAWVQRVRRRGVDLPIHLGVPGPVDAAKLLRPASASASRRGWRGATAAGCRTCSARAATAPAAWSRGCRRAWPTRPAASPACTSTPSTRSRGPSGGGGRRSAASRPRRPRRHTNDRPERPGDLPARHPGATA